MTGIVIPFPTPLTDAVVQHPRRGRLPKAIGSIRSAVARRLTEARKAQEKVMRDAEYVQSCLRSAGPQVEGEYLTGVVVIACDTNGKRHAWWAGSLTQDPVRAASIVSRTVPLLLRQRPIRDV